MTWEKILVWENLKFLLKEFRYVMFLENLEEQSIHYLPCSYTNEVTDILPINYEVICEVIEITFCQGTKHTGL